MSEQDRAGFEALVSALSGQLVGAERLYASLNGEATSFVRINHGRIRQPGTVRQSTLSLRLVDGRRHAGAELTLSGAPDEDLWRGAEALRQLRELLPALPEDPHLLLHDSDADSVDAVESALPPAADLVDAALHEAGDADMVGIFAGGEVWRAFGSSLGQRDWFSRGSFTLDWCLVHSADKAVKSTLAGDRFDPGALRAKMAAARQQLAVLSRPARKLTPGTYRAFLSPAAVGEVMGLLSWGSFGARALAAKSSPWNKLEDGELRLDPRVHLVEDCAGGVAPRFGAEGFPVPAQVPLIAGGQLVGRLVSPRSAVEFGIPHTGANSNEQPGSLSLAGGGLAPEAALGALGDGVLVGNLWYLNWSDRSVGRFTGMTRFATFWVEGGEIVAPVDVMRFDDSLYSWFGAALEDLTSTPELQLSTDTYFNRSTDSLRLPGALLSGLRFTL